MQHVVGQVAGQMYVAVAAIAGVVVTGLAGETSGLAGAGPGHWNLELGQEKINVRLVLTKGD